MKLGTIIAFSVALALPAAIRAQGDMGFSQDYDAYGVDLIIDNAYEGGLVAIFLSVSGDGRTDFGVFSLDLEAPVLLAFDTATVLGTYNLRIPVDTQALARMGLTVYLQAVSISGHDAQPDQELPIRISEQVEIGFGGKVGPENPGADPGQNDGENDHEEETEKKSEPGGDDD